MKIYALILSLFLFTVGCSQPSSEKPQTQQAPVKISTVEFQVEGMTCTGCEKTIQKKLSKVPGVKSAKADHKAKTTVVEFNDSQTTPEALAEAIKSTGYKVVGETK